MFKQLKALRETTAALPAMVTEAYALRDAANAYQTAALPQATTAISVKDPRLAAIAGIDLPTYARVVKLAVSSGRPADDVALELGLGEGWTEAAAGWPARMHGDMSLAVQYGQLYTSAV